MLTQNVPFTSGQPLRGSFEKVLPSSVRWIDVLRRCSRPKKRWRMPRLLEGKTLSPLLSRLMVALDPSLLLLTRPGWLDLRPCRLALRPGWLAVSPREKQNERLTILMYFEPMMGMNWARDNNGHNSCRKLPTRILFNNKQILSHPFTSFSDLRLLLVFALVTTGSRF